MKISQRDRAIVSELLSVGLLATHDARTAGIVHERVIKILLKRAGAYPFELSDDSIAKAIQDLEKLAKPTLIAFDPSTFVRPEGVSAE